MRIKTSVYSAWRPIFAEHFPGFDIEVTETDREQFRLVSGEILQLVNRVPLGFPVAHPEINAETLAPAIREQQSLFPPRDPYKERNWGRESFRHFSHAVERVTEVWPLSAVRKHDHATPADFQRWLECGFKMGLAWYHAVPRFSNSSPPSLITRPVLLVELHRRDAQDFRFLSCDTYDFPEVRIYDGEMVRDYPEGGEEGYGFLETVGSTFDANLPTTPAAVRRSIGYQLQLYFADIGPANPENVVVHEIAPDTFEINFDVLLDYEWICEFCWVWNKNDGHIVPWLQERASQTAFLQHATSYSP